MDEPEALIPLHGGYRKLTSFRLAQLIYDVTVRFCDRYIDRRSPTHDQRVQAARSGTQNIAEGSEASGTSKNEGRCQSVSSAELVANAALSLLNLCCYLLDRQVAAQATAFENEGGFTERLYRVRSRLRNRR
jgi:four helix bundle suffix protein